jgi:hypothetical protein
MYKSTLIRDFSSRRGDIAHRHGKPFANLSHQLISNYGRKRNQAAWRDEGAVIQ